MAPTWSVDRMAETILRGIETDRSEIAPGFQMRMLLRFGSVLKPLLFRHFDRLIARFWRTGANESIEIGMVRILIDAMIGRCKMKAL